METDQRAGEGAVRELKERIEAAIASPRNLGEMADADSVGTMGSPDCGDMLRMWVKFREDASGRRVIDRATFQTFGCQTAIAVASVATEMVAGKTVEEALHMSGEELAAPLGPLPPMKIHCAQLVEGALRSALSGKAAEGEASPRGVEERVGGGAVPGLIEQFRGGAGGDKAAGPGVKVILKKGGAS
jgi:nitrogen fixation NifU-like protein